MSEAPKLVEQPDGTFLYEEEDEPLVSWEMAACKVYADCGNVSATARQFGKPVYRVRKLLAEPWFQEELTKLKSEAVVKADCSLTRLFDTGMEVLQDRLLNGELSAPVGGKPGKRTPIRAADAARITDMAFMKRQLLRNNPTIIPGDTPTLTLLAQKLRALGAKDPSLLEAPAPDIEAEDV